MSVGEHAESACPFCQLPLAESLGPSLPTVLGLAAGLVLASCTGDDSGGEDYAGPPPDETGAWADSTGGDETGGDSETSTGAAKQRQAEQARARSAAKPKRPAEPATPNKD